MVHLGGYHTSKGFNYIVNNQLKSIPINDGTTTVELTSTYYTYNYTNEDIIYNKFFNTENNNYWLASTTVILYTDFCDFNIRYVSEEKMDAAIMVLSDGNGPKDYMHYGVRPVVTLQSGVTTDEIQILEEQTESVW